MELLKSEIVQTHNGSNVVILISNIQSVNELKEIRFRSFTISVQKNILTVVESVDQKLDPNNNYLIKLTYLHLLTQIYYHQDEVPAELRKLFVELIRNTTPLFPPEKESTVKDSSFFDFENTSDEMFIPEDTEEMSNEELFENPDDNDNEDEELFENPNNQ